MKFKYLFIAIISLFITYNTSAQLQDTRICIDPGHGGHDPANDRKINLPHGLVFWESEGNLTTALHEKDLLTSMGAKVKMTRTSNNDSDDISLSSRVAIANGFNADYFQSNHTNAGYAGTNYSLVLFRGTDNNPTWTDAKEMGKIMAPNLQNLLKTTKNYNRGDKSFLGFNLGVLRNTNMPATLSEGSFHDLPQEGLRLKNNEYLKNYAWALTKSFCKYFNVNGFSTGRVGGVVKDKKTGKVLNNVQVTCSPGNKTYIGDDFYNGFYAIGDLEPGTYNLTFSRSGYIKQNKTISIKANKYIDMDISLLPDNNGKPYADFKILGLPAGAGDILTFDASASADDTMIIKYTWDFGDGSPLDTGKIVKHSFSKDSTFTVTLTVTDNSNNESSISKFVKIETTPPKAPELLYVKAINNHKGVKIKWRSVSNENIAGYRIYYNINPFDESINILADTNVLKPNVHEYQVDSISGDLSYYFSIKAVKPSGTESEPSDRYGIMHYPFDEHNKKLLIVDGFHRKSSYTKNYHSFASVSYLYPLYSIYAHIDVTTCVNYSIINGDIKLEDYDIVIWFLGDESTQDETFNNTEQNKVKQYLKNGGKILVTGSEIAWDLDHKGSNTDKAFYHDYLKAKYVEDGTTGRSPAKGTDAFSGVTLHYGVNYIEDYPDVIAPNGGSHTFFRYNQGSVAGIGYKGTFGGSTQQGALVNLGFTLESTNNKSELKAFFEKLLKYFDTKTKIKDTEIENNAGKIRVYPTVFNDDIFIESQFDNNKQATIILYNLKGQMVYSSKILLKNKTKNSLNLNIVPGGMYILKVLSTKNSWSFKIIKKKTM